MNSYSCYSAESLRVYFKEINASVWCSHCLFCGALTIFSLMIDLSDIVTILHTSTIIILIWGRFRAFPIKSSSSKLGALLYDPIVAIHIIYSYVGIFQNTEYPLAHAIIGILLYLSGLTLFLWGIFTTKKLEFAFSSNVDVLVTSGPFSVVRHPFYLSYSLIWLANSLLFNSIFLWITLTYLVAFYLFSAKREEEAILRSNYAQDYQEYKRNVGMMLPRILTWKNYFLGH